MKDRNKRKIPEAPSVLERIVSIPPNTSEKEQRAMKFAFKKHSEVNQIRKYSGKHYIVHPAAVAELVRTVKHTPEMLAAAWLHDTVEDTKTTFQEIEEQFGKKIYMLVEMLTDVSKPEDGNRRIRKEIDRQHTAKASAEAKTIKLADLIHNSKSIIEKDPGFAKVYLREMRALLEVLQEGDSTLWERTHEIAYNDSLKR